MGSERAENHGSRSYPHPLQHSKLHGLAIQEEGVSSLYYDLRRVGLVLNTLKELHNNRSPKPDFKIKDVRQLPSHPQSSKPQGSASNVEDDKTHDLRDNLKSVILIIANNKCLKQRRESHNCVWVLQTLAAMQVIDCERLKH